MKQVAVLFARHNSIYKMMAGCDVWDRKRNALDWPGGAPIVAHPPCRAWGNLKHLAKPRDGEHKLALWAICQIRIWGGVMEHPFLSGIWKAGLPEHGARDAFGGWVFSAPQHWWGHRAEKKSRFYVVGCEPADMPPIPLKLGEAPCVFSTSGRRRDGSRLRPGDEGYRPEIRKSEREHTPAELAVWLVEVARRCRGMR